MPGGPDPDDGVRRAPRPVVSSPNGYAPQVPGGVAVLELHGSLDVLDADTVRAVLTRAADEHRHVLLVAADVTAVDATVLGVLVRTHHRLKQRGGVACLVGASRSVVTTLEAMYLQRVFPSFETVDEAVDWLVERGVGAGGTDG